MMPDNSSFKTKAQRAWTANPAGWTFGSGAQPGTKEFFDNVLAKRSSYEQPWLFALIPFAKMRAQKVLELGCGAGYDAYEFCRNGADYVGIDLTPQNPTRTQQHLAFYSFSPQVLVGDAEELMFPTATFDMVFSNGVLHHTPEIGRSFREAHRVLKAGGDFWVILYHKNSIFYWVTLWLVDHILRRGFLRRSFQERLGQIEYTTSDALPLVNAYSRQELGRLLKANGFQIESLLVRKLLREDLPNLPLIRRLYPQIPQRWLDALGTQWGWYIIAHARKP